MTDASNDSNATTTTTPNPNVNGTNDPTTTSTETKPETTTEQQQPQQEEDELDWSHVLHPDHIAKTVCLVSPKNDNAPHQRFKVAFIPPNNIKDNVTEDMISSCVSPEQLTRDSTKYPKLIVRSAPMKLWGKEEKWAAPGREYENNSNSEGKQGKEPVKLSQLCRSFWFKVGDISGIDPDVLEAEGGEAALLKKQMDNRSWLHAAQIKLTLKWYFAPLCVKELKKREKTIMKVWETAKKGITWDEAVQLQAQMALDDHKQIGILANMEKKSNNIGDGISFQSKVWYKPLDAKKITPELNQKAVNDYIKRIQYLQQKFPDGNHVVNDIYVQALTSGLREHIIPTYVVENGEFKILPPHPDPCRSNLKCGDFCIVEYSIDPYDNIKGAGQTLHIQRLFIISSSVGLQAQTMKLNSKYSKLKNFTQRDIELPKLEHIPPTMLSTKQETNEATSTSTSNVSNTTENMDTQNQPESVKAETSVPQPIATSMQPQPIPPPTTQPGQEQQQQQTETTFDAVPPPTQGRSKKAKTSSIPSNSSIPDDFE